VNDLPGCLVFNFPGFEVIADCKTIYLVLNKIVFDHVDVRPDEFLKTDFLTPEVMITSYTKKPNNNTVRASFFAARIVNVWNRLPLRNSQLRYFIFIQSNCQIGRFIGVCEVFLSKVYFKWAMFSAVYFCLVVLFAFSNFNFNFLV